LDLGTILDVGFPGMTEPSIPPIRIGVSSCLLGNEVRFDGQHKRDRFLVDELGPFVDFVAVCPEVEVGMGIPRETLRLVAAPGAPRMLVQSTGEDFTDRMNRFAQRRVAQLAKLDLCGYVLKSKSPSCGMERMKVYASNDKGATAKHDGVGLFAKVLLSELPNLPVEEEGRLEDAGLRENFIERIFAYRRLRDLWQTRWTVGSLVAFHTANKMSLLAHSTEGYRALGKLVAEAKSQPRDDVRARYEAGFMATLKKLASRGRHANVMVHMLGHMKKQLDASDKQELLTAIEDYRKGLLPLVVPITLLRHHARRLSVAYLLGQTYLEPHPKELMLRNRI
jgi:uncharacterized protein YbgA (DUF1722 family)/uncharacterized protein YbbK (DUF523 family)